LDPGAAFLSIWVRGRRLWGRRKTQCFAVVWKRSRRGAEGFRERRVFLGGKNGQRELLLW